jgi:putative membrane protein
MLDLVQLLLGTVALRPYVFIFLGVYLLLAIWQMGWGRAAAFVVLGYIISWAAELSSITTGFPFGEYLYIPGTAGQELWVAGVPFMDSLSYVFLAYASFTLALIALAPGPVRAGGYRLPDDPLFLGGWRPWVLGAVLMVTLDIVIDPAALRGYRWFLGQIYGYPEGGVYFGVPLANFAGWLLVALILIKVLQALITRVPAAAWLDKGRRRLPGQALLGPGLYLGILGFNLAMTFSIGEPTLGWVGVFIYLPFLTWLILVLLPGGEQKGQQQGQTPGQDRRGPDAAPPQAEQ